MKIFVTPGDVFVASVEVRRHASGIFTIHIATPHNIHGGGLRFGSETTRAARSQWVDLFDATLANRHATRVTLTAETNQEEEALYEGLFEILDAWSRYACTLLAIPAAVLEEAEPASAWEPTPNVDYLDSTTS